MQMHLTSDDLKVMNNPINKSVQDYHIKKVSTNPELKKARLIRQALQRRKTKKVESKEVDYKLLQEIWLQNNKPHYI